MIASTPRDLLPCAITPKHDVVDAHVNAVMLEARAAAMGSALIVMSTAPSRSCVTVAPDDGTIPRKIALVCRQVSRA